MYSHPQITSTKSLIYEDSWSLRQVIVRRSTSPDERGHRLTTRMARDPLIARLTRKLPATAPVDHRSNEPSDPHASWMSPGLFPFGLVEEATPNDLDLRSHRAGRAVRCKPDGHHLQKLALFPTSPENPLCPPYPGLPPQGFDNPMSVSSCFSDGRRARFDPMQIPQLYSSTRPWYPYHHAPHLADGRPLIAYRPVTDFYRWNQPGRPWIGGFFVRYLVKDLYLERASVERAAVTNLGMYEEKLGPGQHLDLTGCLLPWLDEAKYEDTLGWVSWAEGRDVLARTCQYITEMNAMSSWIDEKRRHLSRPRSESTTAVRYDRYMGTWASTISSRSTWTELRCAGVPVYIASVIPENHPLGHMVGTGDLDADERYRENVYNTIHHIPNQWWNIPVYTFKPVHAPTSACPIPTSFCLPVPGTQVAMDPSPSTSAYKPWTSYIFGDSQVPRLLNCSTLRLGPNPELLSFYRESHLMAPFLPPGQRVLTVEASEHPFFHVFTGAKGSRTTYYVERLDEEKAEWWFEKATTPELKKEAGAMAYAFSYPAECIVIYSDHPFPGEHPIFCRVSKQRLKSMLPSVRPRSYVWRGSNNGQSRTYEWTYSPIPEAPATEVATLLGRVDMDAPMGAPPMVEALNNVRMDMEDTFYEESREPDVVVTSEEGMHGHASLQEENVTELPPLSWEERVEILWSQRHQLDAEVRYRLFWPIKGNALRSDQVVPWQVPDTVEATVWPIRIANLHGDASPAAVHSLLVKTFRVRAVDILIICYYTEVDTTLTLEVGLRHCEDALWVWCLLHGVMVDQRILDVYPIKSMTGGGIVLEVSGWEQRSREARERRADELQSCYEAWPEPRTMFSDQLDRFGLLITGANEYENVRSICEKVIVSHLPSLIEYPQQPLKKAAFTISLKGTGSAGHQLKLDYAMDGSMVQTPRPPPPQEMSKRAVLKQLKQQKYEASQARHSYTPKLPPKHMSHKERYSILNVLQKKSGEIVGCCRVHLPRFDAPPKDDVADTRLYIVTVFKAWWDWVDACRDALEKARYGSDTTSEFDWSTVELVFGHLTKLRGVYGTEHHLCLKALKERPCWISRYTQPPYRANGGLHGDNSPSPSSA